MAVASRSLAAASLFVQLAVCQENLYEVLSRSKQFETFATTALSTGLDGALNEPAPQSFTVFAPTDDAFDALPQDLAEKLLSDESDGLWLPQLQDLMFYHVIEGKTFTFDMTDGSKAKSVNFSGDSMSFTQNPLQINGESTVLANYYDAEVDNGVLHAIDKGMALRAQVWHKLRILTSPPLPAVLTPPSVSKNVEEILRSLGGFSRWLAAMDGTRLSGSLLSGPGPYTVFAPTDSAFDKFPGSYEFIKNMLIPAKIDQVQSILRHHVIPDKNLLITALESGELDTLNEDTARVMVSSSFGDPPVVTVEGADVIAWNFIATKSPIAGPTDRIAQALEETEFTIYEFANTTTGFKTFATALQLAGLVSDSGEGSYTVFMPNDAAFERLPSEQLNKLLDPVWKPQTDRLLIVIRLTRNSKVLEPPSFNRNIMATISGNDDLSILTSLLDAAGLGDVLAGKGPLTLFAPSDNAFESLLQGTIEFLLLDESRDVLTKILEYHVLARNGVSSSLTNGSTMTLSGDALSISLENTVDDSTIVVADIIASNGIVQILDSILLPPGISLSDLVVPTQILEEVDEEQNKLNEVVEEEDQSQTSTILAEAGAEETESSEVVGDEEIDEYAVAPVATSDTVATTDFSGSRQIEFPCFLGGLAFGLAFLV
ncbi:hypothetical protein THAOC_16369 [Thalassiosira oceanica]|uniref:FAS1 domain-containing protein n=1 Tax=Thalassiosira oceanica TaxID=159749 RepID=K0SDG5_THAOC|nr:hypothetical protein THAOC_16369 [Thalassiosira oceanica]|eukprot:EJK62999.1 hypothetical protein THAOC_16369 [Thalassiosira oceanica]